MGIGSPWYPDVEPDDLRRAAQAYRDLGTAIDSAGQAAAPAMQRFFKVNKTDTLNPYREAWTALADPSQCPGGYLGQLGNGCRQMASGLDEAASGIDDLRSKIDGMVAGGAVVTVAAGLITFGIGSAAAGAATAGAVATTATIAISTFLTRVAIVAAFEFVGGYLTSLALQAMRQQIFEPGKPIDFDQSEALTWGGISGLTGGLLYGLPGAIGFLRGGSYLPPSAWNNAVRGRLGEDLGLRQLAVGGVKGVRPQTRVYLPGTGPLSSTKGSYAIIDVLTTDTKGLARVFPGLSAAGQRRLILLDWKSSATAPFTRNQRAIVLPAPAQGMRLSPEVARSLNLPPSIPGGQVVVVRGGFDLSDLDTLPMSLRQPVHDQGLTAVLQGEAGRWNAMRLGQWAKSVNITFEVVK